MVADALGSVAAILSGVAVLVWQAHWADPVASLVVTGLLLAATWGLLRDAVQVLLEGVPSDLTPAAITEVLRADPAVADVHHLHVWALTQESSALSAHVVLRGTPSLTEAQVEGTRLKHLLAERFGVHHSTLELEGQACDDG
jgi:cobalt-zinc-cadmium efflux system protein